MEQYSLKMPHAVYAGKGALENLLVNNMRTVTADDARELYLQIL